MSYGDMCISRDRTLSVSSHLTPDPEKRLLAIKESIREEIKSTENKLCFSAFLSVLMAFLSFSLLGNGPFPVTASLLSMLALTVSMTAMSQFVERHGRIYCLDGKRKEKTPEYILDEADLTEFSRLELVNFLDKYLGGGITAMDYYEDIVARVLLSARVCVRKKFMLSVSLVWLISASAVTAAGLLIK